MFDEVVNNVKDQHRWKLHPQPSSMRKIQGVIENFDFTGKIVLDCFCGTGTIPILVSKKCRYAIGSDIELMFIDLLRKFDNRNLAFYFGIDAFEAVKRFEHDVLFIDPPNPNAIVAGRLPSAYRDTNIKGNELNKLYRSIIGPQNLMGAGDRTLKYVINLIKYELERDKEVIINLFKPYKSLKSIFETERIFETYYLIKNQ